MTETHWQVRATSADGAIVAIGLAVPAGANLADAVLDRLPDGDWVADVNPIPPGPERKRP